MMGSRLRAGDIILYENNAIYPGHILVSTKGFIWI